MARPFNPAAWLARWTEIGGSYARTDAGLFLFWHDVQDSAARSELLAERVSEARASCGYSSIRSGSARPRRKTAPAATDRYTSGFSAHDRELASSLTVAVPP